MKKRFAMILTMTFVLALTGCSGAASDAEDQSSGVQEEPSDSGDSGSSGEESSDAQIQSYGTLVEVDGGRMNVLVVGEGDTSIVWMPGFSDIAPGLSYTKILEELSPRYKVYVAEPFGYGLSDVTDKPRTMENITSEIHEAVRKLGADNYVLVAHSLSGIYAMEYVNDYRDEIIAYVGLDTSTPNMRDEISMDVELGEMTDVVIPEVSDEINRQYQLIAEKVSMNANWIDENERMTENFEKSKEYSLPEDLPVAFFLAQDGVDDWAMMPVENNDWVKMHQDLIPEGAYSQILVMDGGHMLYQTNYKEVAEALDRFLAEMP
ncbi:MAG: alpha/beta hydrolase [Eubacteriales bacterium]|nr:alpha/beta hydrolase [Eubacteriales bacterium]